MIANEPGVGISAVWVQWVFNALGLKFSHTVFSAHDYYYVAGGGLSDFVRCNTLLCLYMAVDACWQDHWWQTFVLLFIITPLTFLLVSTIGLLFFDFVGYRTVDEVLEVI